VFESVVDSKHVNHVMLPTSPNQCHPLRSLGGPVVQVEVQVVTTRHVECKVYRFVCKKAVMWWMRSFGGDLRYLNILLDLRNRL